MPAIRGLAASGLAIRVGGSGAGLAGLMLLESVEGERPMNLRRVPGLGTAGGIRAVRAGQLDVAVSARAPSLAESQDSLRWAEYARTPVVFATHSDTAAEGLGVEEAVGMIGGAVTHWRDGLTIRLSRRPDQDSDTAILASLSPAMAQAVAGLQRRPGVPTAGTDHDQAEALEAMAGTLGVLSLSLILSERRGLKPLPLRDGPPSAMLKSLFVVTRGDRPPPVEAFLRRIDSEQAGRILAAHGHMPRREG